MAHVILGCSWNVDSLFPEIGAEVSIYPLNVSLGSSAVLSTSWLNVSLLFSYQIYTCEFVCVCVRAFVFLCGFICFFVRFYFFHIYIIWTHLRFVDFVSVNSFSVVLIGLHRCHQVPLSEELMEVTTLPHCLTVCSNLTIDNMHWHAHKHTHTSGISSSVPSLTYAHARTLEWCWNMKPDIWREFHCFEMNRSIDRPILSCGSIQW